MPGEYRQYLFPREHPRLAELRGLDCSSRRATSSAAVRAQPALTGTSTTREVVIPLDASQQSQVKVGDKVIITLPSNQTTPRLVSSVGNVATTPQRGGTPTITVNVTRRIRPPPAASTRPRSRSPSPRPA